MICLESKLNLIWRRHTIWADGRWKKKRLTFHSWKCRFHRFALCLEGIAHLLRSLQSGFLPSPTTICWKTSSFISIYFSSDYLFKTNEPKYFCGEEKGEERQEDDAPFFKLSTEELCEHSKADSQDKKVNKTIIVIRVSRRAWICF